MTQFGFDAEPPIGSRRQQPAYGQIAFARHVVTAVVVSHDGSRWLSETLRALSGQYRPVQRAIAVDTGSRDGSLEIIEDLFRPHFGPDAVLQRKRSTGFGTAVSFALKSSPPVSYDEPGHGEGALVEWIWILHDDAEPELDALHHLLAVADSRPDVAVVGPKIRGWYDRAQLLEAGVSVARDGRRWTGLERNEHDQGQHDEIRPVLSVSSAGMLVRRDVWDSLRGFDRAFALFRDDLDFCWRVNSAGYQVVVSPRAVVYHAEAAARERRRISVGVDRPHMLDRQHAMLALLANSGSGFRLPFTYLRHVLGALLRIVGYIVAKRPGHASDELLALLAVATRPDRLLRSRRMRRRTRAIQNGELEALFPPRGDVYRQTLETIWFNVSGGRGEVADELSSGGGRRRSMTSAETGPVSEEAESLQLESFAWLRRLLRQPALAVGLVLSFLTLIACRDVLVGGHLMGGALLPAPDGAGTLWSQYFSSWHPVGLGSTTQGSPYLAVVALLATLCFGKASFAVSLLLLGSVPLAGLAGYYALRRVVKAQSLRIWGAAAYALLPAATGAIAAGRLGSAVAIVLAPLIIAGAASAAGGPGRVGSTRSAWTTALGLTVATAFAPVIWLVALAMGVAATALVAWRTRASTVVVLTRFAIILVTPMVVLAPWSLGLLSHPSTFLLEAGMPGVDLTDPRLHPVTLMLGGPGGPGTYPAWFTAGLLLAALGALLRGTRRRVTIAGWGLALLGLCFGLIAARAHVATPSLSGRAAAWPGVPAALLGFGLIVATLVGAEGARERIAAASFGWRQPVTLLVTVAAALAPVAAAGWWVVRGAGKPLVRQNAAFLPPYVAAESGNGSRPRTLVIGTGSNGTLTYGVVRGGGSILGDADVAQSASQSSATDSIVADLLSGKGGNVIPELASRGVAYVVATAAVLPQIGSTLDGVPGLNRLSMTDGSSLWQVTPTAARLTVQSTDGKTAPAVVPVGAGSSVTGQVPDGSGNRVLVLAEQADSHWSATLNGSKLQPTTVDGWAQGFDLPSGSGTVKIGYHNAVHGWVLGAEGLLALFLLIMALPTGRRVEEEEGEEAAEREGRVLAPAEIREPQPEPEEAEEPVAAEYEPAQYESGQYESGQYESAQFESGQYQSGEYDPAFDAGYQPQPSEGGEIPVQPATYEEPEYQPAYGQQQPYQGEYGSGEYGYPGYDYSQYPAQPAEQPAYQGDQYQNPGYGYQPDPYANPEYYSQSEYQQPEHPYPGYEDPSDAPKYHGGHEEGR